MPSKRIVSSIEAVTFKRRKSLRVEKLRALRGVKEEASIPDVETELRLSGGKSEVGIDDLGMLGDPEGFEGEFQSCLKGKRIAAPGEVKIEEESNELFVRDTEDQDGLIQGVSGEVEAEMSSANKSGRQRIAITKTTVKIENGTDASAQIKIEENDLPLDLRKSPRKKTLKVDYKEEHDEALTTAMDIPKPEFLAELETPPEIKREPVPISPVNGTSFSPVDAADLAPGQPAGWQEIYNEVVAMRAKIFTPVDSMGCEKMPDTLSPKLLERQPQLYRFQLLISLMLSSQTKDEINYEASQNMRKHFIDKGFPDGVCIEAVRASTEAELDNLIKRVGFHRRKALYIKKACDILYEKHNGDIPRTIEEVVQLPGVGPKMGHLLLQYGWGINSGIGVDVHIHRLAQKWKWVQKTDKPEATRLELELWLPRRLWAEVNPLLVGFGQTVCNSQILNCDVCTLASKGLCKGVNRKLLKGPMGEARLEKLRKQRADLTPLIEVCSEL